MKFVCLKNRYLSLLLIFLMFFPSETIGSEANLIKSTKLFQAGASTANITPHLGDEIIGEWITPPSSYIHDELYAKSLVLDDGSSKLVFVVLDLLGIHANLSDMAKKMIEQRLNIPQENIIISVTHTHSATSAMGKTRWMWNQYPFDDYQNFVINRIVDVVQNAFNNLEPANIGWGAAHAPEHVFVRRWLMKEPLMNPFGEYDKVLTNPGWGNNDKLKQTSNPDPDISFITVQSKEGRPIAVFSSYSLHYIGGTESGHISADYYGMYANELSKLINHGKQNPAFVASMTNGTSGNVNNWDFTKSADNLPFYVKAELVANDIANKVFEAYKKIVYYDWVPLRAQSKNIILKVRKPNEEMIKRAEKILNSSDGIVTQHRLDRIYAERTLNLLKRPNVIEVPLITFRIGELGVASLPFEVFAETGLEVKDKSPFKQTYVIGIANGYYGYLPTPEQHKLGGYETWWGTNNVEEEASVKLVNQILSQFSDLQSNN